MGEPQLLIFGKPQSLIPKFELQIDGDLVSAGWEKTDVDTRRGMSDMQQHHHHLDPLAWAVLQFQDVLRDISYLQLCILAEANNVPVLLAPAKRAEGKEETVTRYHDTMMDARKRSHVEDDLVLLFEDSATSLEMGAVGASSCEHSITSSIRHVPLICVSVSIFSFFFFKVF